MLKRIVADLHIHTVLSPCAEYRMVPELIVERASQVGLNLIGVTDHNSGENAGAVMGAAKGTGIRVLPGMEVESREGVHILTLFDDIDGLEQWQEVVYAALPNRENDERVFGTQLVVDATGRLVGVNRRLLMTATDLSLEEVVAEVGRMDGLCVPAHVDRPANGLLSVLGLVPEGLEVPALEISPLHTPAEALARFPGVAGYALLRSSDAHALEDVGKAPTPLLMAAASVAEVAMACRGEGGRRVIHE